MLAATPASRESRGELWKSIDVLFLITLGVSSATAVLDLASRLSGTHLDGGTASNVFILAIPGADVESVVLSCIYLAHAAAIVALVWYVLHRSGESLRLRQAGVHPLIVIVVSSFLRASYHVEYGWAAVAPLLFGVGMATMYLASRRLLPAIMVHAGYDAWTFLHAFTFS